MGYFDWADQLLGRNTFGGSEANQDGAPPRGMFGGWPPLTLADLLADPTLLQPNDSFGSLVPSGPLGPMRSLSYTPQADVAPTGEPNVDAAGDDQLALAKWLQDWRIKPDDRKRADGVIKGLTGDEFTDEQRAAIIQELLDNIGIHDAGEIQSINPNKRPIELTPEQFNIITSEIEKLSPQFRASMRGAFQRARDNGFVVCPRCP